MSKAPTEPAITPETPVNMEDENGSQVADELKENVHNEEAPEVPLVTVNLVLPVGEKLQAMIDPLMPDLREVIADSKSGCFLTRYEFCLSDGTPLDETTETLDVKDGDDIVLAEGTNLFPTQDDPNSYPAFYTEHQSRAHVALVQSLSKIAPAAQHATSATVFSLLSNPKVEFQGFKKIEKGDEQVLLSDFFPAPQQVPQPFQSLSYSGWNPPRPDRRLAGDYFYLDLKTLEGNSYVITAWPRGFFVNATKLGASLNTEVVSKDMMAHNLPSLLAKISPKFKFIFFQQINTHFDRLSLDYMSVPKQLFSWVAQKTPAPQPTPFQAETYLSHSMYLTFMAESRARQWSKELALILEMPSGTVFERVSRERLISRLNSDFIADATLGAMAVIDGTLPPIIPASDPTLGLYMFNNIVISFPVDVKSIYDQAGGEQTVYRHYGNEISLITRLLYHPDTDVRPVLSCVIDYMGQRLCCQGAIPGFFDSIMEGKLPEFNFGVKTESEQVETLHLNRNPEFEESMAKLGLDLGIKPHLVKDVNDEIQTVTATASAKGLIGTDGRKYIMEFHSSSPRDLNFAEDSDLGYVLRPELLISYKRSLKRKVEAERQVVLQKAFDDFPDLKLYFSGLLAQQEGQEQTDEPPAIPTLSPEADQKRKELEELFNTAEPALLVNPDVANVKVTLAGSPEENEADLRLVQQISSYLVDTVLPALARRIAFHLTHMCGSSVITREMHSQGVNIRYLGQLTTLVESLLVTGSISPVIWLQREMISRAVKAIFARLLKSTTQYQKASVAIKFLNGYFGVVNSYNGKSITPGLNNDGSKLFSASATSSKFSPLLSQLVDHESTLTFNPEDVWGAIRSYVSEKFSYSLPSALTPRHFGLPSLRSIALRAGIQLYGRDYDFTARLPFRLTDIQRFFPRVKSLEVVSSDAAQHLNFADNAFRAGRLDYANDALTQAYTAAVNVHDTDLNDQVASALVNLARISQRIGNVDESVHYYERAVVALERSIALDDVDTALVYMELAMTLHTIDPSPVVLNYMRRALYIVNMLDDVEPPQSPTIITNLAYILQDMDHAVEARKYLERGLELAEAHHGPVSAQVALALSGLAISFSATGEYREALKYQDRNHDVTLSLYGEKDERTMEAAVLLKQITTNAVNQAKAALPSRRRARLPTAKADSTVSLGNAGSVPATAELQKLLQLARAALPQNNKRNLNRQNRVTVASGTSWRGVDVKSIDVSAGAQATTTGGKKKRGGKKGVKA